MVLYQNYPNPFNPYTYISFDLADDSRLKVSIYDLEGKLVRKLADAFYEPGHYQVLWNARNTVGRKVGSGIYLYRIETENNLQTRKMILIQ